MSARLYGLWALSLILAFMLQLVASRALALLVPF
jgi:hypothetical protein